MQFVHWNIIRQLLVWICSLTPTIISYQSRKGMGWEQLHHLGNHLQTLTEVLLPLGLLL